MTVEKNITETEVKILRTHEYEKTTFGVLSINGKPICLTLENLWLKNERNISCIPTGKYEIKYSWSKKFNKFMWAIDNVPGREGILIHRGNTYKDTSGCILPVTEYGDVFHYKNSGGIEKFPPAVDIIYGGLCSNKAFSETDKILKKCFGKINLTISSVLL
jgi:hypothetical protein